MYAFDVVVSWVSSVGEIETGVLECYGDVRELLVHFRTRTRSEDIEVALQETLEHD